MASSFSRRRTHEILTQVARIANGRSNAGTEVERMMATRKVDEKQARNIGEEILGGLREIKRDEIGRATIYLPVAENRDAVDPEQPSSARRSE